MYAITKVGRHEPKAVNIIINIIGGSTSISGPLFALEVFGYLCALISVCIFQGNLEATRV